MRARHASEKKTLKLRSKNEQRDKFAQEEKQKERVTQAASSQQSKDSIAANKSVHLTYSQCQDHVTKTLAALHLKAGQTEGQLEGFKRDANAIRTKLTAKERQVAQSKDILDKVQKEGILVKADAAKCLRDYQETLDANNVKYAQYQHHGDPVHQKSSKNWFSRTRR
jgi:hypothetical protein